MTYEEFLKFVPAKCIHETLYEDTEGRPILVISMLDAYDMVNKSQRKWVGLTDEEVKHEWEVWRASLPRYIGFAFAQGIETKLKERNNDH